MVIVETSVWVDLVRGARTAQTEWVQLHYSSGIGITDLSLCEVLQGAQSEAEFLHLKTQFMALPVASAGGARLALAAARNYRTLRHHGITVRKTIDCLIATCCIENEYALLHRDRDFDGFEKHLGLNVVHPR